MVQMCTKLAAILCLAATGAQAATSEPDPERINVAIIGGGMAGSAAAYTLTKDQRFLNANSTLTIFERNDRLGGRVRELDFEGVMLEAGGTIVAAVNQPFSNYTEELGLTKQTEFGPSKDTQGVWDGDDLRFETSHSSWWTDVKMFLRYGLTPVHVEKAVPSIASQFAQPYDMMPMTDVMGALNSVGLTDLTTQTIDTYREQERWNSKFFDEMVAGMTRDNYMQNLDMSALGAMVAMCGSIGDLYKLEEGNSQLCVEMIRAATEACNVNSCRANLRKETAVTEINFKSERLIAVTYKDLSSNTEHEEEFTDVLITVPLEIANIKIKGLPGSVAAQLSSTQRSFVHMYTTFVRGNLDPHYFGKKKQSELPTEFTTMDTPNEDFYALAQTTDYSSEDGTAIFEMFTMEHPDESGVLNTLFTTVINTTSVEWHPYPYLHTNVHAPPIVLADGLYYAMGFETFFSAMEVALLEGTNVAKVLIETLNQD
eukprot:Clim_evm53s156 gene=Clim_evmTU53s156